MAEYATPTNTTGVILHPLTYWRTSAFALTAVALLGIVLSATGNETLLGATFLAFDWSHTILHVVLALAAFVFGFAAMPGKVLKVATIVFGIVYGGLGVLGFVSADVGPIHLELGENLIHLLLGGWALASGFGAKDP